MFEIFDQQESFKLDMIDLACGVIRISIKCSCLEIFDQQGNPNLIPLVEVVGEAVEKEVEMLAGQQI